MKRVLITGANGFLGTKIKDAIQSHDDSLFKLIDIHNISNNPPVNITKSFSLVPNEPIDVVFHSAGKAHVVPKTVDEGREFFDVNFEGTKNLCLALEASKSLPESFIFVSTVSVYGLEEGENISELHPLNGVSPYAKSKILAEQWLQDWASKRGITLGILRLPLLAGANPPGNLGAMISGIDKGRYLRIGQARARKSMVWAEDIAEIVPRLAQTGGVYNLTDGHHPSFGELEAVIAKGLGRKNPSRVPCWFAKSLALTGDLLGGRFPINSDKLIKITSTLTFDDRKAQQELGWNPSKVLDKLPSIFHV